MYMTVKSTNKTDAERINQRLDANNRGAAAE